MCLWRFNEFWSKIRQKPQTHRCGAHQSTSVAKCRAFTPPTLIHTADLYIHIYACTCIRSGVSRGIRATFNESTGFSFHFLLMQFREFCWSKRGHSRFLNFLFFRLFVANYNLFASNLCTRKCASTRWFHCSFFIRPWWSMNRLSIGCAIFLFSLSNNQTRETNPSNYCLSHVMFVLHVHLIYGLLILSMASMIVLVEGLCQFSDCTCVWMQQT